jgi:hypothetical protein
LKQQIALTELIDPPGIVPTHRFSEKHWQVDARGETPLRRQHKRLVCAQREDMGIVVMSRR